MSAKSFTARQGQHLAFIDAYTRVHGRPPAETDMQRHFQLSPPSVHQMVLTLERLGHIRRQPGVARSIEVLPFPKTCPFSVTPIGQIHCAEELVGRSGATSVRTTLLKIQADTVCLCMFALRHQQDDDVHKTLCN